MTEYLTKEQVHNRAKEAVGKTVLELNNRIPLSQSKNKNSVGDAFEAWFGKIKDSDSKPDMEEAGVELKATPIKRLKNGQYSAKERLVLNIINYDKVLDESFDNSHFLYKNGTMEIAFYEHLKEIPKDQWTIKETILYEMYRNPVDFEIIRQDWEIIHDYIAKGKAHELSESLTNYLAPCTKGTNAKKSFRKQPCSDVKAKQRAYSLKSGYMTSILRKYVLGDKRIDSIIKDPFQLKSNDLEDLVLKHFTPYIGQTIQSLCERFGLNPKTYQVNYKIASAILGLEEDGTREEPFPRVEEFEKASIVVKTVNFDKRGHNAQSMSFPAFKFIDLSKQTWEKEDGEPSGDWHNFLLDTRFLFFVVKEEDAGPVFKGVKFFSMPEEDIEGPVRQMWEDTIKKLNEGVELEAVPDKSTRDGWKIKNNFIKKNDRLVCHVRPHASTRDYKVNGPHADELPVPAKWINRPNSEDYSDQWMTTQCFWINNDYIKEQVRNLL
ncbi:DNA mismatch repair protein MutH [Enterococcus hirae]|uniref:Sau3AI family type II restriction endonuclease n=1 Tax=Enterococcus TaxID=1350 RepID=UPI000BBC5BB5|nr:Sau3AI family type II restriction endonuclease [Enterococcus hirae]EMF0260461.1 DNA mismatch repair protein MutH [Enterococcus hirae]EMF0287335.1 DNA mismatch repair protein MutH [Enterococcus hirae]MDU1931485.1 Sau3AI family type II restriction endonuclease [Enterococcus hirae]NBA55461.1 DNA mismatch repair protein MutH [Enterococcus hirae]PCE00919.1 DNA mismatch repair protein MutH [Enterococcus hirae]